MVDVTGKSETARTASAEGFLRASETVAAAIRDNTLRKGDALATARIAGIMAAKNTSRTIPLCHDVPLESCTVDFEVAGDSVRVVCKVACTAKTGVEMEALHGAAVSLLTLYDMAKSIDKGIVVSGIRLLTKTGGKSGDFVASDILVRE